MTSTVPYTQKGNSWHGTVIARGPNTYMYIPVPAVLGWHGPCIIGRHGDVLQVPADR